MPAVSTSVGIEQPLALVARTRNERSAPYGSGPVDQFVAVVVAIATKPLPAADDSIV